MKYRKKPVVIDAFQLNARGLIEDEWFWDAVNESAIFIYYLEPEPHSLMEIAYCDIVTLEGTMRANVGDYIIRGIKGEIYPCKPDIFEKTYELADKVEKISEQEPKIEVLNKIIDEIRQNTYFINELTEKEGIDFETVEKIFDKYRTGGISNECKI